MKQQKQITCNCGHEFESEISDRFDLAEDPELEDRILHGHFLSFICDQCGRNLKLEFAVQIVDAARDWELFLVPESERSSYLLGKSKYGDHKRIVIGYAELIEKLKIYGENLDDRGIELIKYYLLQKVGGNEGISVYFENLENENLVFHIHGLRKDEVGLARISREIYNRTTEELEDKADKPPYSSFLTPPYVSVSQVEIEIEEKKE